MFVRLSLLSSLLFVNGCINNANKTVKIPNIEFISKMEGTFELVEVREIFSNESHNAFTDIEYFKNKFYIVFRESIQGHAGYEGVLRLLVSDNGNSWEDAGVIQSIGFDLRDPKLNISIHNTLTINAMARKFSYPENKTYYQSNIWKSENGTDWVKSRPFYDEGYWLWDYTLSNYDKTGLGFAYKPGGDHLNLVLVDEDLNTRTYKYQALISKRPTEADIIFINNNLALSIVRGYSGENGKIGVARQPFLNWSWQELNYAIASPSLIILPDKRIIAAVRLYEPSSHTSIGYIDTKANSYNELIALPSIGDNGYPGLVVVKDTLYVSYYSRNKFSKSAIFLSKIFIGNSN